MSDGRRCRAYIDESFLANCKAIEEILRVEMGPVQQAFVGGRDILVNNVRMHTVFHDWLKMHGDEDASALLMLLLDCGKGFNYLSWGLD